VLVVLVVLVQVIQTECKEIIQYLTQLHLRVVDLVRVRLERLLVAMEVLVVGEET